jgi:hypothetical protein
MKRASSMRLFVAAALVALPSLALADSITFSTPTINLTESGSVQTGYFDILILNSADSNTSGGAGDYTADGIANGSSGVTNTNGTDQVSGITAEVETTGALTFLGADISTNTAAVNPAVYLYTSDSSVNQVNLPSNQDAFINGIPSDNGTNVVAGTPLGLLRVQYSVPANTTGSFPLTIVDGFTDPVNGSIWGDSGDNVNLPLLASGAINVAPAAITPEPSSLLLLVLGAVGLFGVRRLRSR